MRTLILLCFTASLILPGQSEAAEQGLVGYWKLDEGGGDSSEDSSGANNDGVFVGNVNWVDGKLGKALSFTEDQSCLRIEHSESLDIQKELTIALWAKPEDTQPSWAKFICKQKTDEYPYALQYDDANAIFGTVNASARFDTSPHLENFTEWAHLAFVYDGEAVVLYKDGEEVARTAANGDLQHNDLPVTIGSRLDSGQSFKGAIDDVRLYNRPLSQSEIKNIMEGGDAAVKPSSKLSTLWGAVKSLD